MHWVLKWMLLIRIHISEAFAKKGLKLPNPCFGPELESINEITRKIEETCQVTGDRGGGISDSRPVSTG